MENFKISKEKLMKIKDIAIFIVLFLWMIMPILQTFKVTNTIIVQKAYYFKLLKTIAIVGIGTTVFTIYDKLKNAVSKKEVIKKLLPIFLFLIFMIWTLLSCHQAARKSQAFNGNNYRKEGYYMYINYAGCFLCAMLLENKKLRKALLNSFVITSVFLMSINRICEGNYSLTHIFTNVRIDNSVFKHFNHYGYYLMMSLSCALGLFIAEKNKVLKIAYLIAFTMISYALIYNNTFGCYLAILAILIMYAIFAIIKKNDRKSIFVAIIIFFLLSSVIARRNGNVVFNNMKQLGEDIRIITYKILNIEEQEEVVEIKNQDGETIDREEVEEKEKISIDEKFAETGTSRMELWTNGIKFALEKPIIGHGPDNLKDKYLRAGIDQDRPHNLIIYLACVSGIPGMLLYVTAVGIIGLKGIKKLFSNNRDGTIYLIVVITYLMSSMFGNSMYYTSPYFFIFLGSLMHYNLKEEEEKKPTD